MPEHRIGELRLHLRTRGAATADLEASARAFTERLLAAVSERIDRRAGGRLVFVRRLPLRVRARRELFDDLDALDRLADELAAAISLDDPPGDPADRDVAVFADDAAWRVAYLTARSSGRAPAWCHAALAGAGDELGGLLAPANRAVAGEVVNRLAAAGGLGPLLERLPAPTLAALAETLGLSLDPAAAAEARTRDPGAHAARVLVAAILADAGVPAIPPSTPPARASDAHVTAGDPVPADEPPVAIATGRAGLVYLVNGVLELELGELLWRACVPEQRVIAAAFASLIDGDDPAPALLGGAPPHADLDVGAEQRAEIVAGCCAALAAALPRRGLASLPEVTLSIDEGAHGHVVVARAASQPIFAAAATSGAEVARAVGAFLAAWPAGAVYASASLAELDPTRRVQRASGDPPPALSLRRDLRVDAAVTVAVTAGTVAALHALRTGELDLAAAGRIHDAGDTRFVTLGIDAVRIAVRRAGLDRDPGWVPWLDRHVRIQFVD